MLYVYCSIKKANHIFGWNVLFVRTRWKCEVRLPMVPCTVTRDLSSSFSLCQAAQHPNADDNKYGMVQYQQMIRLCGGCFCLSLSLAFVLSVAARTHWCNFQLHVYGAFTQETKTNHQSVVVFMTTVRVIWVSVCVYVCACVFVFVRISVCKYGWNKTAQGTLHARNVQYAWLYCPKCFKNCYTHTYTRARACRESEIDTERTLLCCRTRRK